MRKKRNLALFTLFIIGLISLLTLSLSAQKTDSSKTEQLSKQCSGEQFVMPKTISVGNEAFGDYIKVASLPAKERRLLFSEQSNEQKANFIKVNLALQLIKRPNMTKEQQDFVLDAIEQVSAEIYDKSDPEKVRRSEQKGSEVENKALGLFAYNDLGDFIEPLMTDKNAEVSLLQKYENLLKTGMKARKKLVKEMSLNDRVNIWKTQLVYHLTTANLSQPQRGLILEFLMTLSPATFVHPVNETKEESAKASEMLDKKIQSVFTKAESFAIFEQLGIQKIVSDTNQTNSLVEEPQTDIPANGPFIECDCRWYCGLRGGSCGSACNIQVRECSTWGDQWCNGKCPIW